MRLSSVVKDHVAAIGNCSIKHEGRTLETQGIGALDVPTQSANTCTDG